MYRGEINDIVQNNYQNSIRLKTKTKKAIASTPYIVTLCEDDLTVTNILNLMDLGMAVVRFRVGHITKTNKIQMMNTIKEAEEINRVQNKGYARPVAISIDIPNACIKTGALREDIHETRVFIEMNSIVEMTSNPKYWDRCDSTRIFIDDPYTITYVKPDTEISIRFGEIVMICTEVVNNKTLRCKVVREGYLRSLEFVCFRGVKIMRPTPTKIDLDFIEFSKKHKVDIVTIISLRKAATLIKVREAFTGPDPPLIMCTICEQQGLDNIDEIIKVSDGIILAREFLSCELVNEHKMLSIQLLVGSKCKAKGKPFFISGRILDKSLQDGVLAGCDLADVTNAVIQGAGLVLKGYNNMQNVIQIEVLKHVNTIAKSVEALQAESFDFWRMSDTIAVPVLASHASIVGCALMAKQTNAAAIIVTTVTGSTPAWIALLAPNTTVIAVTKNPAVARKLNIHRGVVPLIYDKPKMRNWILEMEERVQFAIEYALKFDILIAGNHYVSLRKSSPDTVYADLVSAFAVTVEGYYNRTSICPA